MERCRLCGGPVINGRCTECGFNNRKNDSQYRLNAHNEKTVRMHGGDCEEHLNKPEKKTVKRTGSTVTRTAVPDSAVRRRELKKRRQTGTVQKKKGKARFGLLLIIIYLIISAVGWLDDQGISVAEVLIRLMDDATEAISGTDPTQADDADAWAVEVQTEPVYEKQDWDTADANYYEMYLAPGNYTAGYDVPVGRYQLECRDGSVWVAWNTEGNVWDYRSLDSEKRQEALREYDDEDSVYNAYSEVFSFAEDQIIYVEGTEGGVWLTGMKQEDAELTDREPQGLQTIRYADGMEPGSEIPEGVYDLTLRNPEKGGVIYLQLHGEDGTELYLVLSETSPVIHRIGIQKGDTIELEDYDTGAELDFVPSY